MTYRVMAVTRLDNNDNTMFFDWVMGSGWSGFIHYDIIDKAERQGQLVRKKFGTYRLLFSETEGTAYIFLIAGDKLQLVSCILVTTFEEPNHSVTFKIPVITKWERGTFGEVAYGFELPTAELYYPEETRELIKQNLIESAIAYTEGELSNQHQPATDGEG